MVFWKLVELVAAIIVILIFSTQVFSPLWKGTKMFPLVRRRKLESQMTEVKEQVEKEELEDEISDVSQKLKKNRKEKKEDEPNESAANK